ncbi:hypothetical protein D356_01429 [Enterococcus faecium SD2A-2]|uniref:Uncharacterized protein n=1 Tax=Enterococcus faecium SD2A-2 TaxID=1244154 RepID=A0AB73A9H3_ENTFC|nr:hypothetical protein D356_01429 [Enterococcus faecium SD2A-2]KXA11013.1 hypothetical protein HMPREF3199_00625 [Enterococcus faecium]
MCILLFNTHHFFIFFPSKKGVVFFDFIDFIVFKAILNFLQN